MKSPQELESLRQSLRGVVAWEVRCGGLVWYICGHTPAEVAAKWREVAHRPPGFVEGRLRMRQAYL